MSSFIGFHSKPIFGRNLPELNGFAQALFWIFALGQKIDIKKLSALFIETFLIEFYVFEPNEHILKKFKYLSEF